MAFDRQLIDRVLDESRRLVVEEIAELIAERRRTGYGPLYDMVAEYPFREGKGLRPALCFTACRAAGGQTDQAQLSATAIELFHNAFLVHDDVEDESEYRRGEMTLLRKHGAPIAVNVGDATNVLAVEMLLGNTASIGVRKALLVLHEIARMARESAEGQAIELDWIAAGEFELGDDDYVRMAYKKTCWYTVIAPLRIGVICGSPPGPDAVVGNDLLPFTEFGFNAGIAFQIHDDLLNLEADEVLYGKEISGDLFEGKRTIMLLHFLRTAPAAAKRRATRLLRLPRPEKKPEEVDWLLHAMVEQGSLDYGRARADEYSERAIELYERGMPALADGDDKRFLREMLRYVIERSK